MRVASLGAMIAMAFVLTGCPSGPKGQTKTKLVNGQKKKVYVPPKRAIEDFEKAVKVYQGSKGQNLDDVKDHLEDAVKVDNRFAKAWFNLGVVHEKKGEIKEAKAAYKKAADASETFAAPHVNLGRLALKEKKRDEALAQFKQAIAEDPFNPEANNNMSVLLREAKDYKSAVQHARRSLAGNANNTNAYANLALIYYAMGFNDVAKLVTLNAIKLDKNNPDVWNTYGLIELKNNNVTDAISHFKQAIQLKNDHVEALMNLGAIVLSVRDYPRAITLFEEVLKHDKDNKEAFISIAVAKRGQGKLKEAEKMYKEVLKKDSNNYLALFNLAILEHEHLAQATMLGDGTDAPGDDPVKAMEWSINNMTKALKNYERAREYYSSFLQAYQGDKYRKDAEKRMAQVQKLIDVTKTQIDELK